MMSKPVSIDLAILAKEYGFVEPCTHNYSIGFPGSKNLKRDDKVCHNTVPNFEDAEKMTQRISRNSMKGCPHIADAPTYSELQDWFIDRDIKVCISWTKANNWLYEIDYDYFACGGFGDKYEAFEQGLFKAFELLNERK